MRTGIHLHVDAQFITTDDTARRMHEIDVTRIALGIKRPLHDERTFVTALDEPRAAASCDAGAPELAASSVHRVDIALGADAREPQNGSAAAPGESLQLSHFSTSGAFERQYSFVEGDQQPEATLTWRAPAAGTAVKQYLVVRDGRGGVSWASWSFCAR